MTELSQHIYTIMAAKLQTIISGNDLNAWARKGLLERTGSLKVSTLWRKNLQPTLVWRWIIPIQFFLCYAPSFWNKHKGNTALLWLTAINAAKGN